MKRVQVFVAPGCHLCERMLEVVRELCGELGCPWQEIDISGDPALEQHYREHIPVIEIDGERAFTYFVQPHALRLRLS